MDPINDFLQKKFYDKDALVFMCHNRKTLSEVRLHTIDAVKATSRDDGVVYNYYSNPDLIDPVSPEDALNFCLDYLEDRRRDVVKQFKALDARRLSKGYILTRD